MLFFISTPLRAALLALAICLVAPMAQAHHASAPYFDQTKTIILEGVVKEVKLVNPHSYVYFDVAGDDAAQNWRCEMFSASLLKRLGWTKDTLQPGQQLTVTGNPARKEGNVCLMIKITLADGRVLDRNTDISGDDFTTIAGDSHLLKDNEKLNFAGREKYLPNGQPNISGNWRSINFARGSQYFKPFAKAEDFDLTPAGKQANAGYDRALEDPALRCHYVNHIAAWGHDAIVNKIEQTDDAVLLHYGFMDVTRTVHLNQNSHPENLVPSDTGYSIGRWEGDTLVVDTTGFKAGVLAHVASVMHSDQLHSVERFYIDPKTNFLMRDSILTDPLFLNSPKTDSDGQELVSLPHEEYGCSLDGTDHLRPRDTGAAMPKVQSPKKDVSVKKGGSNWLLIIGALAVLLFGVAIILGRKKRNSSNEMEK